MTIFRQILQELCPFLYFEFDFCLFRMIIYERKVRLKQGVVSSMEVYLRSIVNGNITKIITRFMPLVVLEFANKFMVSG